MPSKQSKKTDVLKRIKRVRGQMDAVERAVLANESCGDTLMLLAAVRGGVNSVMRNIMEDHIRLHLTGSTSKPIAPELAEDLVDLVRAYLK